ncbi:MAG: hypothetical protein STSR0009_26640 [Methanoregula sp.]
MGGAARVVDRGCVTVPVVTLWLDTESEGAGVGGVFITCIWKTGDEGCVPGGCVGVGETGGGGVTGEIIGLYVVSVGIGVPDI